MAPIIFVKILVLPLNMLYTPWLCIRFVLVIFFKLFHITDARISFSASSYVTCENDGQITITVISDGRNVDPVAVDYVYTYTGGDDPGRYKFFHVV